MNLSRLAKIFLMATACSAAIAACGDDDGAAGGGTGGGVGGGVGGGTGGGTAQTVSLNVRFAQLIPDTIKAAGADAGVTNPGIRICMRATGTTAWFQPIPTVGDSALGIPPGALSGYQNIPQFPNTGTDVAVYLASQLDAAGGTNTCVSADTANLTAIAEGTIAGGLTNNGYYTATLTGVVAGGAADMLASGLVPCDGGATNCAAPQMQLIADDVTPPAAGNVKVRVFNGVPNIGDVEICVVTPGVDGGSAVEPLVPTFSPVGVGGYTTYEVRAPIVDANRFTQILALRRPVAGVPCSGAADIATNFGAGATVNTDPLILSCGGGGCPAGTAPFATSFGDQDVITAFIVGALDTNPADLNGPGTVIIPVLDQPLP